ncbi:hypothetical protein GW17_00014389 [Ensete ventricosum]|nr:hypothetical protein GW17_00014389 [Ensete ventricosum]
MLPMRRRQGWPWATAPCGLVAGGRPPCTRAVGSRPLQPSRGRQLLVGWSLAATTCVRCPTTYPFAGAAGSPLQAGHNRSCPRATAALAGGRSRPPLCRGALAAAGGPLAGGRAMPCCSSSSLPSL